MFLPPTIPRLVLLALLASFVFAAPLMQTYNYFFPPRGGFFIGNLTENAYIALFVGFILFHPLFFGLFGTFYFLIERPRRYIGFSAFVLVPAVLINMFWLLGWEWQLYFFFLAIALVLVLLGLSLGLSLRYAYQKIKR